MRKYYNLNAISPCLPSQATTNSRNTTKNVVEDINGKTDTDTEFQGMEIQETRSLSFNKETEFFEEILDEPAEVEMYQDEYPKIEKPSLLKGFSEVPISIPKPDPALLKKFELMQICTTSLLSNPKLHEPEDLIRQKILSLCYELVVQDPVFILKLALYCRRECNFRAVSLLLLSFASFHGNVYKTYYCDYFQKCIMTPSEWVSIADFVASFELENKSSLPSMLRKAMTKKFSDFDEYQLAKYHKKGCSRKKKNSSNTEDVVLSDDDNNDDLNLPSSRSFNIKRLIRLLHIHHPQEFVMGLLGKKYPMSEDEFKKLKLKGKFQPENAGKRMRLQIPFTWETQVSLHGNKPQVWHDLILSKKNTIFVYNSVKNLSAIGSSKVFLHQYLYAYNALDEIGGRSERKLRIMRRRKKEKKNSIKEIWSQTDLDFSSELKNVLQETIQSSILRNLSPIEGHSLIFLVNYESIDHVWKDYGLIGFNAICLFTGLVIAQACKSYKLLSCGENGVEEHGRRKLTKEFFSMFIHDYCQHLWEKFGSLEMVRNYLYSIKDKQKIDNLILIFRNPPKKDTLDKFIKFIDYYRRISVNSSTMNLALLTIDGSLPYLFPLESNSRNVCISGFGDAALKTLSKLSSGQSQLEEVESIDSKYKIYNKKPLITPIARPKSQIIWTRVKIFVSSTFLDMFFGERNLLNYCVFPELRRRCRNINVEITPLDLRWGIPEDHSLETCMTRYCLERVQESDIFICFLELEIRLRGWQRAHFYFRDPLTLSLIKCENDISQFRESVNSEESGALNQLKEDIRNSGCPLYENYRASSLSKSNSNPVFSHFDEDFVRTVIDRLWKDILDIVSKKLVTRIDFMSSFISKETEEFIGRTKELEKMTEIILSHKNEFKCIEVQGTGKTAFLCKLATILSNTSDVIVIPFFSDGVMDSFCIMEYLEHQILQLHSKINIDDYTQSSKDDSYLSCIRVAKLISQIQTCGKLVCIIVDEPPKDNVSWIPYCKFPPGVRIIVSSNTSDYLMKKHLSSRRKKYHLDAFVSLDGIKDMKIKKELVVNFLKKMGDKVLTEAPLNNVLRLVASKKESGNIKYLKTLCSVLVSSDAIVNGNEKKKMIKEHLPGNLQDLYHFILERDDEDSHILEPILNILNECEGPSFNQLMRATQNILGKTVSSISLLRSLNRLEIFMEPSLKKVDGLGHTCFLEMNHDRVKDNSTFLMLEILNKDISMKLPDIERMTSFSKLAILCAATYEDIWIYGTDDCVIVEQKAKTMFGLYVHSPVTSLSFVQGSEVISVGLQDGTVSFWDINKRINVSNHPQIHFKPVSSIFLMPLSRRKFKMTVGTWGGELLRVNIIDNEVSQKGLCCKGAICDIVVKLNVNDEILVSCSDTEGYVYIADIKLTLKKCWKLGSPSLTLTGNKLSFLSESEILIGCSDGCIRCFEFKSFNSNFYYYFNHVVNHRYHSLSGKYKIPTFEDDVVICMDSYEGKKVLGYNSGWIRFINKAQVSFCIKLINKEGELCQALMFQENIFILTTNKNRLVSFRFNEELREIYDLREITHVTSDFEYLNFIVPISRAKGIFIYPREDATFEIYQIPEETHNRIRKRPKIDSDIKTYTPILTSEKYFDPDNDFSSPVTFIDYNNGYIFMGSRIILALWKYSSDTNSLEKISEELCSHKINELILKSLPNKGDTFRCYGSYDETGLVTFDLSKVELFSVILYSNGSQERKRIWFNDSKLLSAKPLSEDINSECDDKCEGEKTQDNDETMSNSSRSEDDENSSSSSSDNGLSYNYYGKLKSARNSLIGIDWNSGYKHGIVTLGFEDGKQHEKMDSIEHFFHVNMSNFKVNLRDVASHVQMSESVDIFGSFDEKNMRQIPLVREAVEIYPRDQ
ncbi:TEP1 [Lepeophtheirus salmonis]|uniref:TEP1 n=1 Tax=Lepeophtheirus salmonis TaxID=72036 RepID=A0A7R8H0P4_LEPSM|nr:TEP1 [Lepeophtheirus salmonis]CAF2795003.1 TEP1 [Lepeophtheirus salmonis]